MQNLAVKAKERIWQDAIKSYFKENNDNYFVSQKGKNVTVLSLGEHNLFGGPDFINACVMLENQLTVGDIEFHKKSSNWLQHKHSTNNKYKNVILHIVLSDDKPFPAAFETIIINENKLAKFINFRTSNFHKIEYDYASYDDFRQFALLRLLRRAADIKDLLETKTLNEIFLLTVENFLRKYQELKKRPLNSELQIENILLELKKSSIFDFIENINFVENINSNKNFSKKFNYENNERNKIQINFERFLQAKMKNINQHLKLELLVNSIFPLCFCIANDYDKTNLLLWYLTAKTKCDYGILKRKYPQISQKYIWLQQGMLEHLKEFYNYKNVEQSNLLINSKGLSDFWCNKSI